MKNWQNDHEEKIMTIEEREAALMRAQKNHKQVLQRRRVKMMKYLIVSCICFISIVPVLFSVVMLFQVANMEKKVNFLAGQKDAADAVRYQESVPTQAEDVDATGEKKVSPSEDTVPSGKRVYLTFDDGPSVQTEEILDILKKEKVKATFFVVAKTDAKMMKEYRNILDDGHALGIHSYTHEYGKIYASLPAFEKDVTSMSDLIYAATGVRTHLYRFPGGSANSVSQTPVKQLAKWLTKEGYVYYDWNALNGDAVTNDLSPSTLVENVMNSVEKNKQMNENSTVLMHDLVNKHNTVEALKPLIRRLKKEGFVMDRPLTEDVKPVQQKCWN